MSRPYIAYQPPALRRLHPLAALGRLRQFTDLFITLSLHRVNVRYKQSRLGIVWAIAQPFAMMLVFTLAMLALGQYVLNRNNRVRGESSSMAGIITEQQA